jgi:trimethylamine--corrinoid protein Co-methyltransferase
MDCEILQMIQRYMEPEVVATGPDDIAFDAIKEVGPNGHYFGIDHTQERYEDAFYQPFVSNWQNFEAWEAAGGIWTAERAHGVFKDIISNFEAPAMDPAVSDALTDYVERRKAEGGAPTDF